MPRQGPFPGSRPGNAIEIGFKNDTLLRRMLLRRPHGVLHLRTKAGSTSIVIADQMVKPFRRVTMRRRMREE